MNKFLKVSLVVLGIGIILSISVYVKLFFIGNKNYESVKIEKVTTSSSSVIIKGKFMYSSVAYKDYSYTQVGDEVYVTIRNVKVSSKYKNDNFEIEIPVKGMEVMFIHLTDGKTTRVIYSK